jgi:hypothetical protein
MAFIRNTAYNTRNLPVDTLAFAKLLAKIRGCTLEKMIADALAIGLESWAGALNVQQDQQRTDSLSCGGRHETF